MKASLLGANARYATIAMAALVASLLPVVAGAYPTDTEAQKYTKIRRLKWQQDVNEGKRRGRKLPEGAKWPLNRIVLRMAEEGRNFELTPETEKDAELQAALEAIVKKWNWRRYNIALLEITDPAHPRYAAINEHAKQTPGSTAKVLVAAGLMQGLKERFPDSTEARQKFLQETMVVADQWAMPNHHEVPVMYGDVYSDDYKSWIRSVRHGDTFSLWEWMDHALSPSSNASATMLWREATLLRLLGEDYPPEKYDAELFSKWDKETFTSEIFETVDKAQRECGLNVDDFYVRLFFTRGPSKYIKSKSSRASPFGLLRWLLKVEQGKMVDSWSSLELKRMLYLTRRRIRYAYSKTLDDSAVIFKTGSLYGCVPEEGFTCGKYRGNSVNVLNAIVEVETPAPKPPEPEPAPEPDAKVTKDTVDTKAATPTATGATANLKAKPATEGAAKSVPEAPVKSVPEAATKPVVELPVEPPHHIYLVSVMSNELKRNAAFDHATLATAIHEMLEKQRQARLVPAEAATKGATAE